MNIYIFDLDDCIFMHNNKKINYNAIQYNPTLDQLLSLLNGPKYIYTNGTYDHANEIINNMGILNHFAKIYSRDTLKNMKPDLYSFVEVQIDILSHYPLNNKFNFFFYDDQLINLRTANNLGWITFWIHPKHYEKYNYSFIHSSYPTIQEALYY